MGSSLGLAAYRAISRRSSENTFIPNADRPVGTVLWLHAAEPANLLALLDLAYRLCAARYDLKVVITLPDGRSLEDATKSWTPQDGAFLERLPSEHPDAIRKFWSHWRPDIAIWAWGDLRPNLIAHAHENDCPIALIDADEAGFDSRRDRWMPDLTRQLLSPFITIIVRSRAAYRKLEALGLDPHRIIVTPPLQAGGYALPCSDLVLSDLSRVFKGRPVWFACNIQQEELVSVLIAHRQALRLSHRLLLILHPADGDLSDTFAQEVTGQGFRLSNWADATDPEDVTQVMLAPDSSDLGLFYRLAPVSFMGSSLIQGYNGRNPFEAAALGSAVLYGPHIRKFMPFYSRLAKAGAARIVKDGHTLGSAVTQLIAPDQAATMAHAGWDVVSKGANLTDRVINLVHTALDGELERPDARA